MVFPVSTYGYESWQNAKEMAGLGGLNTTLTKGGMANRGGKGGSNDRFPHLGL